MSFRCNTSSKGQTEIHQAGVINVVMKWNLKSTQYCGACGIEITYPQETCNKCGNKVNLSKFQYKESKQITTKQWYLFPIFLGIVGGVISWALLRESDYKMAINCLLVGIGMCIFHIIIFAIVFVSGDPNGSFQVDWGT